MRTFRSFELLMNFLLFFFRFQLSWRIFIEIICKILKLLENYGYSTKKKRYPLSSLGTFLFQLIELPIKILKRTFCLINYPEETIYLNQSYFGLFIKKMEK